MAERWSTFKDVADWVATNGVEKLREGLARGTIGQHRVGLAKEYLAMLEERDDKTRLATESEMQRRQTDATERQAAEAGRANRIAIGAFVVSFLALLLSLVAVSRTLK